MALAIRSGIPFSVWIREEPAVLATALDLIEEESEEG